MALQWGDIETWEHGRVREATENGRVRVRIIDHKVLGCAMYIYDANFKQISGERCSDINTGYLTAVRKLA